MQIGTGKPLAAGLMLAMGTLIGATLALTAPQTRAESTIEWLKQPRTLPAFQLASDTNLFDRRALRDRWTIITFGFVHCPDICPINLSTMAKLADLFESSPRAPRLNLVFVSVDPGRDGVGDVGGYVRRFHPAIVGVTGHDRELTQLADGLGLRFNVNPDPLEYAVMHSAVFSIVGPNGRLRGRFHAGHNTRELFRQLHAKLEPNTSQTGHE